MEFEMAKEQVLMEKAGERMNVPAERVDEFTADGWVEISRVTVDAEKQAEPEEVEPEAVDEEAEPEEVEAAAEEPAEPEAKEKKPKAKK